MIMIEISFIQLNINKQHFFVVLDIIHISYLSNLSTDMYSLYLISCDYHCESSETGFVEPLTISDRNWYFECALNVRSYMSRSLFVTHRQRTVKISGSVLRFNFHIVIRTIQH